MQAVEEAFAHERLILVVGMVGSKPVEDVLAIWAPIVDHVVVTVPKTERAADAERVSSTRSASSGSRTTRSTSSTTSAAAVDHAIGLAGEDDLVLVFGSFYTASEARDPVARPGRAHVGTRDDG